MWTLTRMKCGQLIRMKFSPGTGTTIPEQSENLDSSIVRVIDTIFRHESQVRILSRSPDKTPRLAVTFGARLRLATASQSDRAIPLTFGTSPRMPGGRGLRPAVDRRQ